MGSPLDDLRKITNQVEKKKEENVKNLQAHKQLEKQMLSEGTIEQQKKRNEESIAAVQRGHRIKLFVIIISFLIASVLIFFISKFIIAHYLTIPDKAILKSDNYILIDENSPDYSEKSAFINDFVEKYKTEPEKVSIPWYTKMPEGKKLRFKRSLDQKLSKPGMVLESIQRKSDEGPYRIIYSNNTEKLTIQVIVDDDDLMKINNIF